MSELHYPRRISSISHLFKIFGSMWWCKRFSCKLIPFGECSNGYVTLMLGDNGIIYGAFDGELFQYGHDILSGLDVLINGEEVITIV
ncbi:hypothetical protein ABLB69_08000 [Xenorhabdus khoisanae]|uniref:hypothetical protein n=1 Tax=Xenorhabdus khoisanae TaxID=880157 RepID=UPI0032B77AA9